jgi:hypothetical protein
MPRKYPLNNIQSLGGKQMSYRGKVALGAAVVFICLLALAGMAAAQGFSADVVTLHGKEVIHSKIFVAKDKMRLESGAIITITRLDTKKVWMLMPTEKMYMEEGLRRDSIVPNSEPSSGELERKLLGSETVNGYVANKYRVTIRGEGGKNSMLLWLAADSALPVKMAAEDGTWVQEYRNLKAGEPDDAVFEIPAGYKIFGMSLF